LLNWTVKTDATGDQQCVTLVIAEFRFDDEAYRPLPAQPNIPGIHRISVESEVLVISDPGGVITGNNPFRRFAYKVRRLATRFSWAKLVPRSRTSARRRGSGEDDTHS
jgi:hypothetical protein